MWPVGTSTSEANGILLGMTQFHGGATNGYDRSPFNDLYFSEWGKQEMAPPGGSICGATRQYVVACMIMNIGQ